MSIRLACPRGIDAAPLFARQTGRPLQMNGRHRLLVVQGTGHANLRLRNADMTRGRNVQARVPRPMSNTPRGYGVVETSGSLTAVKLITLSVVKIARTCRKT